MKKIFLIILLLPICFGFNASTETDAELKILRIDGRAADIKTLFEDPYSKNIGLDKGVIRFSNSFSKMYLSANAETRKSYNVVLQSGLINNFYRDTTWRLGMQNPLRRQYRMKILFKDNNRVIIRLSNSKLKVNKLSKRIIIHAEVVSGNFKQYIENVLKRPATPIAKF